MESKKISFGFSKITKKPNLLPSKSAARIENQVELIKCLEGQEIKLVEERKEETPIVIPLKENGKTSSALASLMKRRAVLLGEDDEPAQAKSSELSSKSQNLIGPGTAENGNADSLEKRAEREILLDLEAKKDATVESALILPVLKPDELPLDGAKESTLNDYEEIPIEHFGLAMLRGMGWVQPPSSKQKGIGDDAPTVRPKGMGLGADKALKSKPLLVQPEANEILEIRKNAYVRILGGKYKDAYGQIEGFDDVAGRVIVKLAIGGAKEAFNEFLCQPIARKEYAEYGKCINTAKYEQYKKFENEHGQIIIKKEESQSKNANYKLEKTENNSRSASSFKSDLKDDVFKDRKTYKEEHDRQQHRPECSSTSTTSRERRRTRSPSPSQKHKSMLKRRHQHASSSDDSSGTSTGESDTDSAYEQRHRRHKKSKSHKSKSSKKKRSHYSSSDCSSGKASSDLEKKKHKHKKIKKKTKKSKKHRSHTPPRHRK